MDLLTFLLFFEVQFNPNPRSLISLLYDDYSMKIKLNFLMSRSKFVVIDLRNESNFVVVEIQQRINSFTQVGRIAEDVVKKVLTGY